MSLAEEIAIFQINRGGDFLISKAKKFLEDYSFYEFSKSQLSGLERVIESSSDFSEMEKNVNNWINKQAEREKAKNWGRVKDSLPKELFGWERHTDKIKLIAKNKLNEFIPITDEIDFLITDAKLRNDLERIKYELSKKFFYTLITLHRCYNKDDEIKEKLVTSISWGREYED